jgi:hypothetical protein
MWWNGPKSSLIDDAPTSKVGALLHSPEKQRFHQPHQARPKEFMPADRGDQDCQQAHPVPPQDIGE